MKNIKTALTLISYALLLSACNQKELTSGINKKNMDTLVSPGDNFANYVNGTWYKNTKIPADKASYGAFDLLYDQWRCSISFFDSLCWCHQRRI